MTWADEYQPFHIVQLGGSARSADIQRAVNRANRVQGEFAFEWEGERKMPDLAAYTRDGIVNLDAVAADLARSIELRPLVFITDQPYLGEGDDGPEPYYSNFCVDGDEDVVLIGTHLWQQLHGRRPLEPYLFQAFGTLILAHAAGLGFHEDTVGCAMDYNDDPAEIDVSLRAGGICEECETELRSRNAKFRTVAAARRLLRVAAGKHVAFVVMSFAPEEDAVWHVVRDAANDAGWSADRADQAGLGGNLMEWALEGMLSSSTVIADVTGDNPNVLFEAGYAYAHGRDLLLMSRDEPGTIFNLTHQLTLPYTADPQGLQSLRERLAALLAKRARTPAWKQPPSA
jgi:hypothetical protein